VPWEFDPQQYATPANVSPQVVAFLTDSDAKVAKVYPPLTATGSEWPVLVPSPNWPLALYPQQYAKPVVVSPHVYDHPAERLENFNPPVTATGLDWLTFVPSPN